MMSAMSDTQRYILVGVGTQGALWCRSVLPRLQQLGKATCVGAVDTNAERLKFPQEYLGLRPDQCFGSLIEALDSQSAHFVINSTPTIHHEKIVDIALTYGLHILSEGPVADSIEGAVRTYRKMKESKRKMAVLSTPRYDQDKQTLAEYLRGPQFGRVNYIAGRFTHNFSKFASWGRPRHEMLNPLLVEAGSHHIDILRALTQSDVRTIFAMSWNPLWGEYKGDSCATVVMQMANGVHCTYEGALTNSSTLNGFNNEYFRAETEKATIELDRRAIRTTTGGSLAEPSVDSLPLAGQEPWGNALLAEQFVDWLAGGAEPSNTLKDHMQSMAATFAAVESAHTGKAIEVPDFLQENLKKIPKGSVTRSLSETEPLRPAASQSRSASSSALDLLLEDPLEDILGR
jgi:predicted dehydrogenase